VNQDCELDVVVFGATGFTGRLVAGYLAARAPADVRVGLAGRSEKRLADVRSQLPAAAAAWPLLVDDSADPAPLGPGRFTAHACAAPGPVCSASGPVIWSDPPVSPSARVPSDAAVGQ